MNLGLVGCGQVASLFHAPAIREVPGIKIGAVADVNREQVERFRCKNRIEKRYTDYRSMFAECDIDSVLICTPPRTHARIILDSIDRGLHVLCEKPFVSSTSELDRIIESIDKDLVIFPCHNYVFTPSLSLIENLVKTGGFGDLAKIEAHLAVGFNTWRPRTDYRMQDRAGVIPDLLYHVIYVVNRTCGPLANISGVKAERGNNHTATAVDVQGELRDGALAELSATWKTLLPHFRISLYYSRSSIETDLIWHPYRIFAKGIHRELLPRITQGRLDEIRSLSSLTHPSFKLLHENFLHSVTSKSKPEVTVQNVDETLRTIQAVTDMAGI